jgi:hypothetical protein
LIVVNYSPNLTLSKNVGTHDGKFNIIQGGNDTRNYSGNKSSQYQNILQTNGTLVEKVSISQAFLGLLPPKFLEGSLILFTILTSVFIFTMSYNPAAKFYFKYRRRAKQIKELQVETPLSKSYIYKDIFDREKLIPLVTNVSHNILGSITVYGIFLSFIIVNQNQIALNSMIFIIWLSFILSIIVRGARHVFGLSDIWARSVPIKIIKESVVEANQFYKNSIYLLIPLFASSVSFLLVPEGEVNLVEYWDPIISLSSIVLGTISLTYLFLSIVELEGRFTGTSNLIFIVLIFLTSMNFIDLSPLTKVDIEILNSQIPVPVIWISIISMANLAWIAYFSHGYIIPLIALLIARITKQKITDKE